MAERIPLYYTFGNHMHWVDFAWLWGSGALPSCVEDMLRLCRDAGVKGCVNFDGIGYEKLGGDDPETFAVLREAVREGVFEIVGGSYGQPYGLFHGSESNVRQMIYGQRASLRLFGVPVKSFWEEEFYFFPQLPQILEGVGIRGASLFFQWTWHTPEVPRETAPVVLWEGQDGSRLPCATRNGLNLHQWPEDMDIVLAQLARGEGGAEGHGTPALVQQWLELMPSPDWMCRSELILPKLRELMSDARFEVRPVTLAEYLAGPGHQEESDVPRRRYTMDDVWHGMTLGKNADNMRRLSREAEASLLSAETLAAVAGLFGRPYPQWDVYPTWELEEGWRELLSAQHHDNDECEGLCGYVGRFSYHRSLELSRHVARANLRRLAIQVGGSRTDPIDLGSRLVRSASSRIDGVQATDAAPSEVLLVNPLGWARRRARTEDPIPAFGYRVIPYSQYTEGARRTKADEEGRFSVGTTEFRYDRSNLGLAQITSDRFPEGVLSETSFLCHSTCGGSARDVPFRKVLMAQSEAGVSDVVPEHGAFNLWKQIDPVHDGLLLTFMGNIERPDPGLNASLQASIHLNYTPRIVADQPYGVSEIHPIEKGLKKYPTGDWMTSEQWFEEVRRPFTSLTFVDLVDADNPDRGLLVCHDGSQQWFLDEASNGVRVVLSAYDPWDEEYFRSDVRARFLIVPHGPMTNSARWKIAQEFQRPMHRVWFSPDRSGQPKEFSPVSCDADNVALTAFYRETRDSAKGQTAHAADVLGVDFPYVLRLAELDGTATEATLTFGATVADAVRTNLLGEPGERLEPGNGALRIALRPYEIATVYLDLVEGRKQVRDLDAKREVWATVHRVSED